jgi:acetoin utilization deacetylase AcuC-like enzyme
VPLPAGIGDDGYLRVFEEVLAPLMRRYAPGLLLISAGYDAHIADPLAGMAVSTAGFGAMARLAVELAEELCEGRIVACLEGGYHLDALGDSVLETLRVFAGEEPREREQAGPGKQNGDELVIERGDAPPDVMKTIVTSVQATHMLVRRLG